MGISLPSEHPRAFEQPTFGEIVNETSTPVASTFETLAPIVINLNPSNQTDTSASLTGQLVSAEGDSFPMLLSLHRITGLRHGWMLPMQMVMARKVPHMRMVIQSHP